MGVCVLQKKTEEIEGKTGWVMVDGIVKQRNIEIFNTVKRK